MEVGHNQPPSNIEFTQEIVNALGAWLLANPVVQTEESARTGKLLVDRAMMGLQDLEAERDGKVRPLNEQVKNINSEYRAPRELLTKVLDELKERLDAYRKEEEARRAKIAEEARRKAEEAEALLRTAEEAVHEAQDDADSGVEADIAAAIRDTGLLQALSERTAREADRAERESTVRIGGGFRGVLTARTKETLIVVDGNAAISQIGFTEKLLQAIIEESRKYRREHGHLPEGVRSEKDRRI